MAKWRAKRKSLTYELDVGFLRTLWKRQEGKCKLSGIELKQVIDKDNLFTGSIDQINPSKGYSKDNVQFVSVWANRAKTNLSESDFRAVILQTAEFMQNE